MKNKMHFFWGCFFLFSTFLVNAQEEPSTETTYCQKVEFLNVMDLNLAWPPPNPKAKKYIGHYPLYVEDKKQYDENLARYTEFRATNYGYIQGVPSTYPYKKDNSEILKNLKKTSFFKKEITLNKKIIPALKCVEEAIKIECQNNDNENKKSHYDTTKMLLSGHRHNNSFGAVISNHQFGIAVDVDPANQKNYCCGCRSHNEHLDCKRGKPTPYKLTKCWIQAFEHHGFYWLGRHKMEDTMHFEFRGDPQQILSDNEQPRFLYDPALDPFILMPSESKK